MSINTTTLLLNRKKALLGVKQDIESYLRRHPKSEQQIRISISHGHPQYYLITPYTPTNGTYIKKKNLSIASKILQTNYYHELLISINKELQIIDSCITINSIPPYEDIYLKLSSSKRELITPIIDTDEVFLRKWEAQHPEYLNPYPFPGNCFTDTNHEVRSKSEILIANALIKYEIPFRYECKITFKNRNYYPDFTCLNLRTKKTWIWEHAGLLSNSQYASDFCERADMYETLGYHWGDGLIATFECHDNGVNTKCIDSYINRYLL